MILKFLALSNKDIINLKDNKSKNEADERKKSLVKKLKVKFIFYFILSIIFLLSLWYFIAMFGAIYKNTQIHLLKDTLISFGLSLIYPFFINLLPGFFRVPVASLEFLLYLILKRI